MSVEERAKPSEPTSSPPGPRPPAAPSTRLWRWLLAAILALALLELLGHRLIAARVPAPADWEAAADFVRAESRPRDAHVATPSWADPLMREAAGDLISIRDAGRSDLDSFERLWSFSIEGRRAEEAPPRPADLRRRFGRVTVERWDLGSSPVLFDLTSSIRQAEVSLVVDGRSRPCAWREGAAQGGRLGGGPMRPRGVFTCDRREHWVWVGETVNEDLELRPRHCVWQHPSAQGPVRVEYDDVPLGERIVLYAGIYYEHERHLRGGPAEVAVEVNGRRVGSLAHRDGLGWQRVELPTGDDPEARGSIAIEVTAAAPHQRSICWAATTQRAERRSGG